MFTQPIFTLSGRTRHRPHGDAAEPLLVLQVEEATRPPQFPESRWRDATTGDIEAICERDVRAAQADAAGARKTSRRVLLLGAFGIITAAAIAASSLARAETIDGERITIIDGDTVALPCDPARGIYPGCAERLRLVGIDAPETGRRARCEAEAVAGLEAKAALAELLRDHPVEITRTGVDKYRRTLAHLSVAGRSVDEAMLATGLALPYAPGRPAWAARCRHWCPSAARCEE